MIITLTGASGRQYYYEALKITDNWNEISGGYAFSYSNGAGWPILYVGQAKSYKERFPTHERWAEAVRRGAIITINHPPPRDK